MATQTIGRYEIVRELGRGSMGVVYEATDTQNGVKVALKVLTLSQSISGVDKRQAVARFQREASAAGSLVHPNIAQVYESGEFNGNYYMVMEFCKGTTLRNMLKHEKRIPEHKLRVFADQLLSALEVAHAANIIHRDIKPDNIMVGTDNQIKLMDFGIAKFVDAGTMTQTGMMMGSPAYMSPEQIMGKSIDARTDLFSTAVTIYECLTGRKPFEAETVTAITHQIMYTDPEPISIGAGYWAGIIWKAMQKEPANRYQNASQMRLDLKNQRAPIMPQMPAAPIQNQTTFAPAPTPQMIQPQQPYNAPPQSYGQQTTYAPGPVMQPGQPPAPGMIQPGYIPMGQIAPIVDSTLVWIIAFVPLIGIFTNRIFNPLISLIIVVGLNLSLTASDQSKLKQQGFNTTSLGAWSAFLIPVWLFRRVRLVGGSNDYAIVWIVTFCISLFA